MRELIFVYNADSGKWNAILDSVHKAVRPDSYDCRLCQLTHGVFKEHEEWSRFRESVDPKELKLTFLHRDEFQKAYRSKWLPKFEYPIILERNNQQMSTTRSGTAGLDIFISSDELRAMKDATILIESIKQRL